MKRFTKTMMTTVAAALLAGAAHADSVGMSIYNDAKADGIDTSGISLSIDVTETATTYDFTFLNTTSIVSSITKLYFDNSLASVLTGTPVLNESAGVNFQEGGVLKDPPLSASIGWTGSLAYLRSEGTVAEIGNGIASGGSESLTVSFGKVNGTLLGDVLDLLNTTGGIVVHLVHLNGQGISTNVDLTTFVGLNPLAAAAPVNQPGGSDDIISTPTPASALAGVTLLGFLAARRRKLA